MSQLFSATVPVFHETYTHELEVGPLVVGESGHLAELGDEVDGLVVERPVAPALAVAGHGDEERLVGLGDGRAVLVVEVLAVLDVFSVLALKDQ